MTEYRAELTEKGAFTMFRPVVPQARDLTGLPLIEQRALLKSFVAIHDKRIRISAAPSDLVSAARDQGLEGVIGK